MFPVESRLGLGLLLEELLQDRDDAAGFRQVTVLRTHILQQHIPVSTALQELAAAKQGVVTHLCLPHEALQAVHVLDGLWQEVKAHQEEEISCKRRLASRNCHLPSRKKGSIFQDVF